MKIVALEEHYPSIRSWPGRRRWAWGWHQETAVHFLHMVLSGVFDRTFLDYFRENVYITPSGMFSQAQLQYCAETVAIDRFLFSVDYPFIGNDGAIAFLQQAKLPEESKRKIAHQNTERLLRL